MRHYPEDEWDLEYAEGVPEWMLEALRVNPDYCNWGVHEDYMMVGDSKGWDSSVAGQAWAKNSWQLDDLNEVVNFYFSVDKNETECPDCEMGYSPEAQKLFDGCYRHRLHDRSTGYWINDLTQDEVDALWNAGRLGKLQTGREDGSKPSIQEVNDMAEPPRGLGFRSMGHDAINIGILVRARAKRLGFPDTCTTCDGYHAIRHNPRLNFTMWVIHPRKGAARGVEFVDITEEELPEVYAYLREAAQRNADRFGKVPS